MARRGRHIRIPVVEEFNGSYSKFLKTNTQEFQGRPSKVYLRLLCFGIDKGWFDPQGIYQKMLELGFLEYPRQVNDAFLLKYILDFFIKDKNWKKEKLLKALLEEDEDGNERPGV